MFHNNSENNQLPINLQLAITLFHFRNYSNAASIQKVGLWAGIGVGTVDLCTQRVMMALCSECSTMSPWPGQKKKSRSGPRSGWRHTVAMSGGMAGVWWMGPWCRSSAGRVSSETPGSTGRATIHSMYRRVFFSFHFYPLICFSAAHLNP